jgi:hypothetical protein
MREPGGSAVLDITGGGGNRRAQRIGDYITGEQP